MWDLPMSINKDNRLALSLHLDRGQMPPQQTWSLIFPIRLRTAAMSAPISDGFLQPPSYDFVQGESPHSLHFMYLDNLHLEIYLWLDICAALCHGLKRASAAVGLISLFQSASVRLNSTGEPNSGRLQCTTLRSKTDRIRQVSAREHAFWRRGRKNNYIVSSVW